MILGKLQEAIKGKIIVEKMLEERLENELLVYQVTYFNKQVRDLVSRYQAFQEWNRFFADRLYFRGQPFEKAIESMLF